MILTLEEIARFWARVDRPSPDGCWPYRGEYNNHGYGRFSTWRGGRTRHLAHRLAFVLVTRRPISRRDVLLHQCDNPPCVNPGHLQVGTQRENLRDAMAKGRMNTDGLALGGVASARAASVRAAVPTPCLGCDRPIASGVLRSPNHLKRCALGMCARCYEKQRRDLSSL